jgi:hypothetical protein
VRVSVSRSPDVPSQSDRNGNAGAALPDCTSRSLPDWRTTARSRATVRVVTEEANFWSRLTWVSLVRGIRRIVVNEAENIAVVRLLLENDTVF